MKSPWLALLCLATAASGARALDSAAYRLQLDGDHGYRLQTTNDWRPAKPTAGTSPLLAAKPYASEIAAAAREAGLDPALVHALIQVESAYRADAVSEKGALGLMQLMPETARRFGVLNATEPRANLKAGTRYLRALLDQFDQRTDLALAAYNAGEGAILRHAGNIPPYPETQRYVPAVLGKYDEWRNRSPGRIDYTDGTRLNQSAPAISRARPL